MSSPSLRQPSPATPPPPASFIGGFIYTKELDVGHNSSLIMMNSNPQFGKAAEAMGVKSSIAHSVLGWNGDGSGEGEMYMHVIRTVDLSQFTRREQFLYPRNVELFSFVYWVHLVENEDV